MEECTLIEHDNIIEVDRKIQEKERINNNPSSTVSVCCVFHLFFAIELLFYFCFLIFNIYIYIY